MKTTTSDETFPAYQRGALNCLLDGRLYQRGQVMTWDLDKKRLLFAQNSIGIVVNFWSKLDADMSECSPVYVYRPTPHSANIMDKDVHLLADYVATFVQRTREAALILCEAGKTRSVFFAVLVFARLERISLSEAYEIVDILLPSHKLKPQMIEYLQKGK